MTSLQSRVSGIETEVAKFSNLKPETEATLKTTLTGYSAYLVKLGLRPPIIPSVHVENNISDKHCYHGCALGENIYLLAGYATPALVVHEFTHTVINNKDVADKNRWQYSAIEAGVANYLTADFLGTAVIDETNLDLGYSFGAIPHTWEGGQGEGGAAWGAYVWKLRSQASDKNTLTKEIVQAFNSLDTSSPRHDYQEQFLRALVNAGLDYSQVRVTFASEPN